MPAPQVYAGTGSENHNVTSKLDDKNVLSGPNWIPKLTDNLSNTTKRWYCLDLLGKYHTESKLKQFHGLTFYFRNSRTGDGAIITSMLPESFVYSIGGNYSNAIKLLGSELINSVASTFSNGNISTTFNLDTSLTWQSPKRMELVFRIPVFDDSATGTNINYQEAIDLFGEAILPEISANATYESIPGPNLLTAMSYRARNGKSVTMSDRFNDIKNKVSKHITDKSIIGGEETKWDRISIQVGGLLLLDWCIIKDLKVTFPNTKAMVLHNYTGYHKDQVDDRGNETYKIHLQPLQAELEVTVATVMGVTRATFKDMLYQTESTNQGNKYKDTSSSSSAKINDSGTSQTKSVKTYEDTVKYINNMSIQPAMSFVPGYEHSYEVIQYPGNNMTPIYRAKEQQNMSFLQNLDNNETL